MCQSRFSTALQLLLILTLTGCGNGKESETKSGPKEIVLAAADTVPGAQVFIKNCKVCHASGLNGAPIFGNRAMWAPRLSQGIDTLIGHASNGYELMPARGGNTDLSDDDVAAAVHYMVSQVE